MVPASTDHPRRRTGPDTRRAIQRAALELFTEQGYEATSMREIAEALGIRKASLYYHFRGKEEIVRSLLAERGSEAEHLLESASPAVPAAVRAKAGVLHWVDSFSADKLRGIRFLKANPLLLRSLSGGADERLGSALSELADRLGAELPRRSPVEVLQIRMALLSINAAVEAAADGAFTDEEIILAARRSAEAIMDALVERSASADAAEAVSR